MRSPEIKRPQWRARVAWTALLVAIGMLLAACGDRAGIEFGGPAQGTTYRVVVVAAGPQSSLQAEIEQRLAQIDRALSNYRADSELSRFNAAPVGEWLPLGPDLHAVLKVSQVLGAQTDGAFDVTSAPLVALWGFGPAGARGTVPDAAAIAAARALVDYRRLEVDAAAPRARKNGELRIDVNGIAQGYTVDCLAKIIAAHGYRDFMVEVGGELRLAGTNAAGRPWRIGIEQPADTRGAVRQAIGGSNIAITTAGDYHDYYERDGVRYSHTIDPATGRPIAHELASVTVITSDAAYADGMDTALEVLGPERGYALAERLRIAAYFIVRDGESFSVRYTPEFARYLR